MRKKDAAKATEDKRIYGDLSSDDEQTTARNKMTAKKPKSKGVKWSIVFLLSLFVLPGIFGAASYFYDYLYPTVALQGRIRSRLVQCYSAANPSKLSEIDHFLKKYEGREHALFAQLKEKYRKIPECQF